MKKIELDPVLKDLSLGTEMSSQESCTNKLSSTSTSFTHSSRYMGMLFILVLFLVWQSSDPRLWPLIIPQAIAIANPKLDGFFNKVRRR